MKHKDVLSELKQSLKVIDGGEFTSENNESIERRMTPRWRLEKVLFRSSFHSRLFSVVDLSLGGMSLALDREDQKDWLPGLKIQGVLSYFSEKIPIQARIRHKKGSYVGCEFEPLLSSVQAQLERFLNPEELGGLLRWVPFQDSHSDWFVGPCGTCLLIRREKSDLPVHISVYVLGQYVQWEKHLGVMTGRLTSSNYPDEPRGLFHLQTRLLEKDQEVDSLKLSIAKKVILSSNVAEEFKSWCKDYIFRD